jgi:Spy/CpxP family protein refolding chaperone
MAMSRYLQPIGITAAAALVAAGLTTGALAQDAGENPAAEQGRRAHAGAGLRGLDLTDTQRQQIRDVREKHRGEMEKAADRLRAAHRAQREAAHASPADEARIRATAGELAEAMTEMAVLRSRVHQEMLSVLTPEQQERAKTLRAERGDGFRGKGERGRRGGPRGFWR